MMEAPFQMHGGAGTRSAIAPPLHVVERGLGGEVRAWRQGRITAGIGAK